MLTAGWFRTPDLGWPTMDGMYFKLWSSQITAPSSLIHNCSVRQYLCINIFIDPWRFRIPHQTQLVPRNFFLRSTRCVSILKVGDACDQAHGFPYKPQILNQISLFIIISPHFPFVLLFLNFSCGGPPSNPIYYINLLYKIQMYDNNNTFCPFCVKLYINIIPWLLLLGENMYFVCCSVRFMYSYKLE